MGTARPHPTRVGAAVVAQVLITLVVNLVSAAGPGAAQTAPAGPGAVPACAPTVADLPLSVDAAFSGTVRSVVDGDGTVVEQSLRCAYGEGAEPAIDLQATWAAGGSCGTVTARRADGVPAAAVELAAADLLEPLGGDCPEPAAGVGSRSLVVGLAGLAVGTGVTALVIRRRRRRRVSGTGFAGERPPIPSPPSFGPLVGTLAGRGATLAARRPVGLLILAGAAAVHRGDPEVARASLRAARASEEVRLPAGRVLQDVAVRVTGSEGSG